MGELGRRLGSAIDREKNCDFNCGRERQNDCGRAPVHHLHDVVSPDEAVKSEYRYEHDVDS